MPFNNLLRITDFPHDTGQFRANKVLVFNLGFDRKGWTDLHWLYFPEKRYSFYRVGFYDNIFNTDRMSLYIEIGYASDETVDMEEMPQQVLKDLKDASIIDEHKLVSYHQIILDPAYVHIASKTEERVKEFRETLAVKGIYSLGRYGSWTYCSIEDNIIEAKTLAQMMNTFE